MDKHALALAAQYHMQPAHAQNVIELLDGGATIPFIARYRKEMHGNTDDQTLREFSEKLASLRGLDARREEIAKAIQAQDKWTDELARAVESAKTLSELEDIYRPYRPKRKTRASVAREKGLEGLATLIRLQRKGSLSEIAQAYVNPEKGVETPADALSGASDILAEDFSDDAAIRAREKALIRRKGALRSRTAKEGDSVYRQYADFSEPIRLTQSHRVLAINRGEKEEWLKVSIEVDEAEARAEIAAQVLVPGGNYREFLENTIEDAWTRLLFPSLEREIRAELTDRANEQAIRMFAQNLKPLLMQPPLRGRVTLGFDPAYRTGCKLAVVDETGKVLKTGVVYPTPPHNKKEEAARTLSDMIRRYHITAIAIGNGTASKESEIFVSELLRDFPGVGYMMVSEAGASVYSASKLGAEEFPDFDVSLRSAVSIARRLQDPLSELVKIDPKAIGVGQYQHDMPPARLDEALTGVVEDCVNGVGVDVNIASPSLLSYVSGLTRTTAKNIVAYREENGAFTTRAQLKKVPRLGPKAFEQCAGFLRIPGGKDLMENTGVHPESYDAARALLKHFSLTPAEAVGKLLTLADAEGFAALAKQLNVGEPTLRDIAAELSRPGRDPRDELPQVLMRSDVMDLKDLQPGMELRGTVRNVTDFGAFVDIGVHRDGLVHISQMAQRRVNHPSEVVRVGDIVTVWVLEADAKTNRISLTMRPPAKGEGNFSTTKSTQTKKLT